MAYIRLSSPKGGGSKEKQVSQKQRCVSRIDLWGLELLGLSTISITQIMRSEKQSGQRDRTSV